MPSCIDEGMTRSSSPDGRTHARRSTSSEPRSSSRSGSRALDVALASLEEGDPIMARDIIKILAPALFDVRYVSSREATPHALHPPVPAGLGVPTRHLCESCDKECGTAGALASHRRTHLT